MPFFRSSSFPMCLVLAAGAAAPVWAIDPETVGVIERADEAPDENANIAFNFKDAPFDQVLDFFSRESGLPIIREPPWSRLRQRRRQCDCRVRQSGGSGALRHRHSARN